MNMNLGTTNLNDIFELPKEEALKAFYDRMVTIPSTAISALKRELVVAMGEDRSKGIFIRYGWHSGVSDGKKALTFQWEDELDLIRSGPKLHMAHGYLGDVVINDIKYDKEGDLEFIDVSWLHSFEVDEYLKDGTYSKQAVCHILCGYASGYLSTVLKRPILVKETKCGAMGYDNCEVICKPIEKWGGEQECEYSYYQSTSMIQELDEVTEKLKMERDNLTTAYNVHRKLIEGLLSKKGLQRIVNLLYKTTGLPTFIEDEYNQIMVKSDDVTIDFDLNKLSEDKVHFIQVSPEIGILRTPIFFEQQVKGYCSFLYTKDEKPSDLEHMILEQASLTASIILLNENIKINTEQNIRRGFLSDVLENRIEKEELYKIAYYLHFNPEDSYWMLTMERNINHSDMKNEIEVNEGLVRHINSFFRERNINTIVSQKSSEIIMLVEYSSFQELYMKQSKFIQQLLKHCSRRFPGYTFHVGVSSVVENIDQISTLYEETLAALKAKNPKKRVQYYEDLGIESVLFQIPDETLIHRFVHKQVGELLEVDKNLDLIQTLYAYIENGMNINGTAKAISMSISGLRYRLEKISDILGIDLDDTKSVFSVYMALNILKAKGEIAI
ncbi:helix-turn-helix domain-containing protein [Oceanobacillus senegalensis]|uniref:helix-turn-helix domain-containing protein n=1 Tax=Oceanobacillus senegalensis TaxID=1936063 RepID=UPI001FEC9378|nr:helix-turn-helix domain-containing protein [Oceanobacillus senegalensis]